MSQNFSSTAVVIGALRVNKNVCCEKLSLSSTMCFVDKSGRFLHVAFEEYMHLIFVSANALHPSQKKFSHVGIYLPVFLG